MVTSGDGKRDYDFDDVLVLDGGFVFYIVHVIYVLSCIYQIGKMFLNIC